MILRGLFYRNVLREKTMYSPSQRNGAKHTDFTSRKDAFTIYFIRPEVENKGKKSSLGTKQTWLDSNVRAALLSGCEAWNTSQIKMSKGLKHFRINVCNGVHPTSEMRKS